MTIAIDRSQGRRGHTRLFEGMVALVTGGGSGIGQETAIALAVAGAEVVIAGRRADALERTAAKQNSIRPVPGDIVSDAERSLRLQSRRRAVWTCSSTTPAR